MSGAIGIIGVGHLAGYLVEGLKRKNPDLDLVLSPRNAAMSRLLADRWGARVADDNGQVVERSSIVVLATRPEQSAAAAAGLPWRASQTLVSVAAGLPAGALAGVAAPARVVRAMPVACAAINESPTAIFPDDLNARALFSRLGVVQAFADEASFEAASVFGAVYGWAFALVAETSGWAARSGLPAEQARTLAALVLRGAAGMALRDPETPLPDILATLATPGGITRLGLDALDERGALAAWSDACEIVLARLREGAGR